MVGSDKLVKAKRGRPTMEVTSKKHLQAMQREEPESEQWLCAENAYLDCVDTAESKGKRREELDRMLFSYFRAGASCDEALVAMMLEKRSRVISPGRISGVAGEGRKPFYEQRLAGITLKELGYAVISMTLR